MIVLAHHEAGPVLLPALIAFVGYALTFLRFWIAERRLRRERAK